MARADLPDDGLLDEAQPRAVRRERQNVGGAPSEGRPDSASPAESDTVEAIAQVAENTTLAHLVQDQFDLNKTIGGPRGILEGVVPVTLFSVVYGITQDVRQAALTALASSAVFAVWRLIRREPLTQALGGMVGVGIGAFLAVRTGRAENYFLPTILKNIGFVVAYVLSIVFRWPLVGLVLGFVYNEMFHWREVPARYRVYVQVTWLWAAMFGLRLVFQVPLWLISRQPGGEWATSALGFSAIPLGLPLFLIVAYLTWVLVRRVPPARVETEGAAEDKIVSGD